MSETNNPNAKIGQQNIDSRVYNVYGDRKIKKFFGVLPFFTDVFLGREEDIKAVRQKLVEGNHLLLLVNGEGGIGKTTLAAQYYLQYQDEYQHLAWVYVATNLTDALLTLAIPLGVGFADNATAEERMRQLLDELRNLKRTLPAGDRQCQRTKRPGGQLWRPAKLRQFSPVAYHPHH